MVLLGFRALPGVFDAIVTPLMDRAGLARENVPNGPGNVFEPLPVAGAEAYRHRSTRDPTEEGALR
ncbi:MAG: hypothetical protein WBL35_05975 [Ornithinibacter sp.]